jgi:hypothetical protein
MSTTYQDHTFGAAFLESIIEWIAENVGPDRVYSNGELIEWVRDNVSDPADVYEESTLRAWAESNGYTKEEE